MGNFLILIVFDVNIARAPLESLGLVVGLDLFNSLGGPEKRLIVLLKLYYQVSQFRYLD